MIENGQQQDALSGLTELNALRNHLIFALHKLAEPVEAAVTH
jgi:hypothetical protein